MKFLFSPRSLGLSGTLAVLLIGAAATPALAAQQTFAAVDTSACAPAPFSQPFLSAKDSNWYTLVAGQTPGNFGGGGWTLSGGAKVVGTPSQNGLRGAVLDLPSGAKAVSPAVCVTADYPTARTMVRNVVGAEGVHLSVAYGATKTWDAPQDVGQVHGNHSDWTLANPLNIHPGKAAGWQLVRFTLVASGTKSDFQIYDFYVDPRVRG